MCFFEENHKAWKPFRLTSIKVVQAPRHYVRYEKICSRILPVFSEVKNDGFSGFDQRYQLTEYVGRCIPNKIKSVHARDLSLEGLE